MTARECYDGGHVFFVEGTGPTDFHHRCWKCGAEEWDWGFRIFAFVMYPIAWVVALILAKEDKTDG